MKTYEDIIEELFELFDAIEYNGCLLLEEEERVADLMREYYRLKETNKK